MALTRVRFTVAGEAQISRAFVAYGRELDDMSEPLEEMADVILAAVRGQFDTQGMSGLGVPWARLSPEYEAWKSQAWPGRPILVRSGGSKGAALNRRRSVTVTPHRMVYEPRGRGGEILSYHQAGHEAGPGHGRLPQRKIVALTTAQKRLAVDRVFSSWLNRQRRARFRPSPG